jgi:thiamine kinase-like enzyme
MSITSAYSQRLFLTPQADFISESQFDIIKLIMSRHGENSLKKIKLIDENDEYDSFLVESQDKGFCLKMSFDSVPIFYEHMILKGIEYLQISPQMIDRNQIEYGKTIYYTIQTFEYSDNMFQIGASNLLNNENLDIALATIHKYCPPKEVWPYLDDTKSFLEYHQISFDNILCYVEKIEEEIFSFIKKIYENVYDEIFKIYENKKSKLNLNQFVHGNLNLSTIISNSNLYKFINFENSFVGSPFFDLANLVFEAQMSGVHEYDFITNKIKNMNIIENRLKAGSYLEEYKICKEIWIRKKFLDMIRGYIKEVIVLNKTRVSKMSKLGHYFSNHFYRFDQINEFRKNKEIFIQKFNELILD